MKENKLSFYEIDTKYVKYLKQFDNKIPNISYDTHNKFFCGVVLNINDINYFAPVSSFKKQQRTNFLLRNENNDPISSLRLSYMFPAPNNSIRLKDFHKEDLKYQRLLMTELKYCNDNIDKILSKAFSVYKIGIDRNNPISINCCDFKLLESKYLEYVQVLNTNYKTQVNNEEIESEIIRNKIICQYKSEYPSIKCITTDIAKKINDINEENGQILTIKELKFIRQTLGKKLEVSVNKADFNKYKNLTDIIYELNHTDLVDKHNVKVENSIDKHPKLNKDDIEL